MKVFSGAATAINKISALFSIVSAICLFAMAGLTFVDVFMRYFLSRPITGSQEFVEFMMIFTIYGGLPYATSKWLLLSVEALTQKFRPLARKTLTTFFTLLCMLASGAMCAKVFEHFRYYAANPLLRSSILKWPYWPFYLFTSMALALMTIEMLVLLVKRVNEIRTTGRPIPEKEVRGGE